MNLENVSKKWVYYTFTDGLGGGHAGAKMVEALRYKPDSRRFDSRWCH